MAGQGHEMFGLVGEQWKSLLGLHSGLPLE